MYFTNAIHRAYNMCPYTSLANTFVFLYEKDEGMQSLMNESKVNFFQNLKFMISEKDEEIRNQKFLDFLMKVVPESFMKHVNNGFINMENDTLTSLRLLFVNHTSMVLENECEKCSRKREITLMFVSAFSLNESLRNLKKLMMKTSDRTTLFCSQCKRAMKKSVRFGDLIFVNTYRDEKFTTLTLQKVSLILKHNETVYELKGLIHAFKRHFSCYVKEKNGKFWYLDDDGTQRLVDDAKKEKINPEILIYAKQNLNFVNQKLKF